MAKKGGVQQLQADLHTDEDFDKFLERPGLLVMDIYSEWCGPCLGMVGSLRKVKLELGGDNLHLAICKADTISYLERFRRKSEPTWLFVVNGMAVNLMFGTNVPKLMKLIVNELNLLNTKERIRYAITEEQPEEVKRRRLKEEAIANNLLAEQREVERKRRNYLLYVTDQIMENLSDIGVTMFGPQVNRDMYKKIVEPADAMKLQCKDRRVVVVSKADFDVVNFDCHNPLSDEILEQLDGKELMFCYWKMPEDSRKPLHEVLNAYAHELTKERVEIEELTEEEHVLPPIIAPMDLKIEVELADDEECLNVEEPPPPVDTKPHKKSEVVFEEFPDAESMGEEEEEEGGEGMPMMDDDPMLEIQKSLMFAFEGEEEDKDEVVEEEAVVEEAPKKRTCPKTITIPPIWVGGNARTHAALIYVFFRAQTNPFLPPDPVPEPPHVIMAFDVYKKRDLISLAERNKDDLPMYGFFTSDDANEAKYLANSASTYATLPQNATDKLVLKVNKRTSHTMLSLATYGPSYVSPNAVIGREEALKFFPPDKFKTAEQERLEREAMEEADPKKKKRKTREARSNASVEDSGESMPPPASTPPPPSSPEEAGESAPPPEGEVGPAGEAAPPGEDAQPGEGAPPEAPPEGEAAAPAEAAVPAEAPAQEALPPEAEEPPPEE